MGAPLNVRNDIDLTRENIRTITGHLRTLGVNVDTSFDDLGGAAFAFGAGITKPNEALNVRQILMRSSGLYQRAISLQTHVFSTTDLFHSMTAYKELHELFQEIERLFNTNAPLLHATNRSRQSETNWHRLQDSKEGLQTAISKLLAVVQGSSLEDDEALDMPLWITRLRKANAMLDAAVQGRNDKTLGEAANTIRSALGTVPSLANSCIFVISKQLKLELVAKDISSLYEMLDDLEVDAHERRYIASFRTDIEQLRLNVLRIEQLVQIHNAFQRVDNNLRTAKELLHSIDQLLGHWEAQRASMDLLCTCGEKWATELLQHAEPLGQALAASRTSDVPNLFKAYRRCAQNHFYRVDKDFIVACDKLRAVDGPLARVRQRLMQDA